MKLKADSTSLNEITNDVITHSEVSRSISSLVEIAINSEIKKVTSKSISNKYSIAIEKDFDAHIGLPERDNFNLHDVKHHYNLFKDSQNYSRKTQRWQGHILELKNDNKTFVAKLEDLSNPSSTNEILEFEVGEVSPDEIELVKVGAIFYWSIGTVMTNGQIKKQSILRFKRVASWTMAEFDSAADLYHRFKSKLPKD
jgi:hypothetical protein